MTWASRGTMPPISGTPVPGRKAGSRPSMSREMYTGPSPSTSSMRSITAARPISSYSSMVMMV